MNSVCGKTTLILIWPRADRPALMQLCVVKLNIYQRSVLACSSSQKPWAGQSLALFHHLGFAMHLYLCFGRLPAGPSLLQGLGGDSTAQVSKGALHN